MKIDKLIKKQITQSASANPDKFFPVKTLTQIGLIRQKCGNCGVMFWSKNKRKVCGDTSCVGEYSFIENTPAKKQMEFAQTYHFFRDFMEKRGYKHVNRFPIVARWRDDLDFNIASIIGFQPYITKGLVEPPSNLVIIPQNCLRFGDIDNVGFTGRHGTNFVMIGQLAFEEPKKYDQAKYIKDLLEWFTIEMKIPLEEIQLHEDAWVGGGDCGPSIEFFSRGLEIANQVYMIYDMSSAEDISGLKELKIKVLDMGMGLERACWFSKGSVNQYEAVMPVVCKYLFKKANFKPNWELYKKFLPYSGNLNLDEVEDIDKAWELIAEKIGVRATELKKEIEPIAGIYSIADHTRTLLYALTDGALPSNVKGGYNLRLVLRRALDYIYKFNWDIDLLEVIKLQAKESTSLYPELETEIEGIVKIINLEIEKYKTHKEKVENKINSLIKKDKNLDEESFIKYYISEGITPEEIQLAFKKQNKEISVPNNFFTLVNQYFESKKNSELKEKKNKLSTFIQDCPDTIMEFYDDTYKGEGDFQILKQFEVDNKKYIILDKTLFYPTMGGQSCDLGKIGKEEVIDVIKVGGVILHQIK